MSQSPIARCPIAIVRDGGGRYHGRVARTLSSLKSARAGETGPAPAADGDARLLTAQPWRRVAAAARADRPRVYLAATIIVLLGIIAYANSFGGVFLSDDYQAIVDNPNIRHLWPIWTAASAWPGSPMAGRPVVNVSFALNYAIEGGLGRWGYHFFNLAVHLLAGLALFGVARRTLLLDRLSEGFARRATVLAALTAALWVVHPLQTESVTYIVQRAESIAGLLYLLVLYCVLRAQASPRPGSWYAAAVAACAVGAGTKEILVTAPVMLLLYDRLLLAGSWREVLGRRWPLYLGLLGSWAIILGILLIGKPRVEMISGVIVISPWEYARSQFGVILHYLWLSLWPVDLCINYLWPVAGTAGRIVPQAAAVLTLVAATAWGLWRRRPWALAGAWFFLILAPTSSVVPVLDLAYEHRMYLPLAGEVMLIVCGAYWLGGKAVAVWAAKSPAAGRKMLIASCVLACLVLAGLTVRTVQRNTLYQDGVALWLDTLRLRPDNFRARFNLAGSFVEHKRFDLAEPIYNQVIEELAHTADTGSAARTRVKAHYDLAFGQSLQGRYAEAQQHYLQVIEGWPEQYDGYYGMAILYSRMGDANAAIRFFQEAQGRAPRSAQVAYGMGIEYIRQKKMAEALRCFRQAVEMDPEDEQSQGKLGVLLASMGDVKGAVAAYLRALAINPRNVQINYNLGSLYMQTGNLPAAVPYLRSAVKLDPALVSAHFNLGNALLYSGDRLGAAQEFQEVLRLNPADQEAAAILQGIMQGKQ